jgi:hypothetical protein
VTSGHHVIDCGAVLGRRQCLGAARRPLDVLGFGHWVHASLNQQQRLQQLFFPEGLGFDGKGFNRTKVTAPFFKYLEACEGSGERVVSPLGVEPRTNRLRVCCSAS